MQISTSNYSIAEMLGMLERRELIVNSGYQRGSGIWPVGASSYFIDTILEGFPFPKIYLYEYMDRTARRPVKEIVDGQQRITAIRRFCNDEFAIIGDSEYVGKRFSDLTEDVQDRLSAYTIAADVVRNANRSDILQMFRRMNAYTLPLNEAEKRHSQFQGAFKWAVNGITDSLDEFFREYGVLTDRQIVRMADAELICEIILATEQGMISTSPTDLRQLYMRYDDSFPSADAVRSKILDAVDFIVANLSQLRGSYMMKPYAVQSLIVGLIHNRHGIGAIERQLRTPSSGAYSTDVQMSENELISIAQAHEVKEFDGPYGKYVWGATGGTNRANRRTARLVAILRALGANVPADADANLA